MREQLLTEVRGLRTRATIEYSGDPEGQETLVLAHGLASPELSELRERLAGHGYPTISVEQPRTGYIRWFGDVADLRARVIDQVAREARRTHGIGRVAFVGHSLGGIDVMRVVEMIDDADTVSSVELVATAGLSSEGLLTVGNRLRKDGRAERQRGNGRLVRKIALNALKSPGQAVAEGLYGGYDSSDRLAAAASNTDVGLHQFEGDIVFPPDLVYQNPVVQRLIENGQIRSTLLSSPTHSCHGAPICDPDGTAQILHDSLINR